MSQLSPKAPAPTQAPLPAGTRVLLDTKARFLDRDLLSGGSPWRLLRLPGASRPVVQRWRGGGDVGVGEERLARTLVQQGLLHPIFASDDTTEDIDVIIPVRDDVSHLDSLLSALRDFHVTVVDDASLDDASLRECCAHHGVDLVRLERNLGPAGARNTGVHSTTRPLLWFIDADVTINDAVSVVARLRSAMNDPLVAASAPRITGPVGATARERFEQRFSPLDMGASSALVVPRGIVAYVPSACLLVRRHAFGDGFDETLLVGEDVDLVWRLHDQGWLVRYDAQVVVSHAARPTWGRWLAQRIGYGVSSSHLALRHGSRLAPLRADGWTLVAWCATFAGKPLIGARIAKVAQRRLRERLEDTTDDPDQVANELVGRGMIGAGGPLARAIVRNFGAVVLVAALHPKLRRRALLLFVVGTAWRFRSQRPRASDLPLAIADDMAYGVGLVRGAMLTRSPRALTPHVTKSTLGLREVLGLRKGPATNV